MHRRIPLYDISKILETGCTIIEGKVFNNMGHNICGVLNQHEQPCKRIGNCPFHSMPAVTQANSCNGRVDAHGNVTVCERPRISGQLIENVRPIRSAQPDEYLAPSRQVGRSASQPPTLGPLQERNLEQAPGISPGGSSSTVITLRASGGIAPVPDSRRPPKLQYKHGWSKEEHYMFLRGLQIFKRGAWKQISLFVKTRTATQVQSHAQKFFLRKKQSYKNKRSIHDLSLDSSEMREVGRRLGIDRDPLSEEVRDTRSILGGVTRSYANGEYAYENIVSSDGPNQEFTRTLNLADYTFRGGPRNETEGMSSVVPRDMNDIPEHRHREVGVVNVQASRPEGRFVGELWGYENVDGNRHHRENDRIPSHSQGEHRDITGGFAALETAGGNSGVNYAHEGGASSHMGIAPGHRNSMSVPSRFVTLAGSRNPNEMRAEQGVAPAGSTSGVEARHM